MFLSTSPKIFRVGTKLIALKKYIKTKLHRKNTSKQFSQPATLRGGGGGSRTNRTPTPSPLHTHTHNTHTHTHTHTLFYVAKGKKRNKGKKERVSKQKLLTGCHQGQNVIVLVI